MGIREKVIAEKASEGDRNALLQIWNLWSPGVKVFLNNNGSLNETDREDLHQEIMGQVFRSLKTYKSSYAFSTWIYTIARNKVIDWQRKKIIRPEVLGASQLVSEEKELFSRLEGTYSSPESTLIQDENIRSVRNFIKHQSDKDRQILFLTCYEEMSGRETAKILGIPRETVRDRLKKLKKKLKEEIYENVQS